MDEVGGMKEKLKSEREGHSFGDTRRARGGSGSGSNRKRALTQNMKTFNIHWVNST